MSFQKRIISSFISAVIIFGPLVTYAAGLVRIVPESCNKPGGCSTICDFALLAQNVLNDSIYFAIVVSALLFTYAGWQYLTSGGDQHKVAKSKKVFLNVIIGLCLIVGAWIIINTILNVLTGTTRLRWNRICN